MKKNSMSLMKSLAVMSILCGFGAGCAGDGNAKAEKSPVPGEAKEGVSRMEKRDVYLNEDCSNFYFREFNPEEYTAETLKNYIMHYVRGGVKGVLLNPNAMRCSYRTSAEGWNSIWDGCEVSPDGKIFFKGKAVDAHYTQWIGNARRFNEKGIDPYAVWLETLRGNGVEGWISMRMNDCHNVANADDPLHNDFWRENPQFRVVPGGASGLDFSHPEVRQHILKLVRELFDRYDMDGFEADWMRSPRYFKDGCERENAKCLTEIMREIKKIAVEAEKKRGHKIMVSVRIPSRPEFASRLGFDYGTWVDERLVDMVTVSNFYPVTDSETPVEVWKRALGGSVRLAVGLELQHGLRAGGRHYRNTPEHVYGFANQFFSRGADAIYFFNHMYGKTGMYDLTRQEEMLWNTATPSALRSVARRHVWTYPSFGFNAGINNGQVVPEKLVVWAPLRFDAGKNTAGRGGYVIVGCAEKKGLITELLVKVNGVGCGKGIVPPASLNYGVQTAWRIPPGVLRDDDNLVELCNNTASPVGIDSMEVAVDAEK